MLSIVRSTHEREALLVLRLWFEPDALQPLRIKMTRVPDLTAPSEHVSYATSVEEVCAEVSRWIAKAERVDPHHPLPVLS